MLRTWKNPNPNSSGSSDTPSPLFPQPGPSSQLSRAFPQRLLCLQPWALVPSLACSCYREGFLEQLCLQCCPLRKHMVLAPSALSHIPPRVSHPPSPMFLPLGTCHHPLHARTLSFSGFCSDGARGEGDRGDAGESENGRGKEAQGSRTVEAGRTEGPLTAQWVGKPEDKS